MKGRGSIKSLRKRIMRFTAAFLTVAMLLPGNGLSLSAQAAVRPVQKEASYSGGLCPHHPEHTDDCGYEKERAAKPCRHKHTEACYRLVKNCIHEHGEECYVESSLAGTATFSEATERELDCAHRCSEESGCVTKQLSCQHEHDGECGYREGTEGHPCTYFCEICAGEQKQPLKELETEATASIASIKTESINYDDESAGTLENEVWEDKPAQISFSFDLKAEENATFEVGDTVAVKTNIGALFSPQEGWDKYPEQQVLDEDGNLIATVRIDQNGQTLIFTMKQAVTEIQNGEVRLLALTVQKELVGEEEETEIKALRIGEESLDILIHKGEEEPPVEEGNPGLPDVDTFWKNAWSCDNYTGSESYLEVNSIASIDLYGSTTYTKEHEDKFKELYEIEPKYPNVYPREPISYRDLFVEDPITEKGIIDPGSVQICASIPAFKISNFADFRDQWHLNYFIPTGVGYAQRSGTLWQPLDGLVEMEQQSDETLEDFKARLKERALRWGIYQDEEGNQTFLCNFGNVGKFEDGTENNGVTYEEYAPHLVEEHQEIFGEEGASGGNIVSYHIQFKAYYPEVDITSTNNSATLTVSGASNGSTGRIGGNTSGNFTIINGAGIGMARKNALEILLVDRDEMETAPGTEISYQKPIEGGRFTIEEQVNGEWEEVSRWTETELTTNKSGRLTLTDFEPGTYRVLQTGWVDGYAKGENNYRDPWDGETSRGTAVSLEEATLGEFTITSSQSYGFGVLVENWKRETLTIRPEDQTIYTGGTGGAGTNASFPHPIYLEELADGSVTELGNVTFQVDGADWEDKTAQYPFDVKYYRVNEDGTESEITTDENYGDYIARIVPLEEAEDKEITTSEGQALDFGEGVLRIRYVSDYQDASANALTEEAAYYDDSREDGKEAAMAAAEGTKAAVILPEDTQIALNGNANYIYPKETDSRIALLFDELLPGDGADRADALKAHAAESGFALDGKNTLFRYIDLVDANNSNAWVSSSKGSDVFWPYPEGTGSETDFQLLHFKGLHREYSMTGEESLSDQIAASEVDLENIQKSDAGIWFHVDAGGFSPFLLAWSVPSEPETPPEEDPGEEPNTPVTPPEEEDPEDPDPTPEEPENPEDPDVPETPEEPEEPGTPETPEEPDTPEVPEEPEEPDTPDTPAGDTPGGGSTEGGAGGGSTGGGGGAGNGGSSGGGTVIGQGGYIPGSSQTPQTSQTGEPGAPVPEDDTPGYIPPHPEYNDIPVMGAEVLGPAYAEAEQEETADAEAGTARTAKTVIPEFSQLYQQNNDLLGWLTMPGTGDGYTVMNNPSMPTYYLHHTFDRQPDDVGVPFTAPFCTADSDNILIHGHNMHNKRHFGYIWNYQYPEFRAANPVIDFKTIYDAEGSYEVMAVFFAPVYPAETTGVFKWYQYAGDMNKAQFDYYVQNVKAASLYDTGVTAEYGDRLITLETCANTHDSTRLVLVARKKMAQSVAE